MTSTLNLAIGQPEESPELRRLRIQKARKELERLRDLVLCERSQSRISLASLYEMERGLSDVIKELDRLLLSATSAESILSTLKKAQTSVRKARQNLNVASDILDYSLEKRRSPRLSKALYENYEEFVDFLLEAIEQLEI